LVIGFSSSPDNKKSVAVHSQTPDRQYKEVASMAKSLYKDVKVVEESASRTLFTYAHTNAEPGEGLHIATATSPVCTATVDCDDPAFAAEARKIAATVGPVK
jgi:hypothetical protein